MRRGYYINCPSVGSYYLKKTYFKNVLKKRKKRLKKRIIVLHKRNSEITFENL